MSSYFSGDMSPVNEILIVYLQAAVGVLGKTVRFPVCSVLIGALAMWAQMKCTECGIIMHGGGLEHKAVWFKASSEIDITPVLNHFSDNQSRYCK